MQWKISGSVRCKNFFSTNSNGLSSGRFLGHSNEQICPLEDQEGSFPWKNLSPEWLPKSSIYLTKPWRFYSCTWAFILTDNCLLQKIRWENLRPWFFYFNYPHLITLDCIVMCFVFIKYCKQTERLFLPKLWRRVNFQHYFM